MALKKACDIFGTVKDVKSARIIFEIQQADGSWTQEAVREADMCPRAVKRAKTFMWRAVLSPTPQMKTETATTAVPINEAGE